MHRLARTTLCLVAVLLFAIGSGSAGLAQQQADVVLDAPDRGIEIDQEQRRVDLDLSFLNHGETRQIALFELQDVPEGWDVAVWNSIFRFRLTEYVVEPTAEDPGRAQRAALRIQPPLEVEPGEYSFTLLLLSGDGAVALDEAVFTVTIREGVYEDLPGDLSIEATIPALQGEPGAGLGYDITIRNDTEEETTINLSVEAPDEWRADFRERFGEQRVISAVSIPAQLDERITLNVTPPLDAEPGEYDMVVTAESEQDRASIELQATIAGHGTLVLGPQTQTGMEARAGGSGTANIMLVNPGTADLNGIQLRAEAQPDWEVQFGHPDSTVRSLPRGTEVAVPVTVTPPSGVAAGDYMVTVWAEHEEANLSSDLRVMVTEPNLMQWLGVALIVAAGGGIVGLFARLARR